MIQGVVRWSVRHRVLVVATTLALAVVGSIVGSFLKFDALPDVTNNQVLVLTRAPGLTPEEVERLAHNETQAKRRAEEQARETEAKRGNKQ